MLLNFFIFKLLFLCNLDNIDSVDFETDGGGLFTDKKSEEKLTQYSSFQCIGGSQVMETSTMQHTHGRYPINEADTSVCMFNNICSLNGTLTYFVSERTKETVPTEYLPEGFGGNMFFTGHLRGLTLPIKTVVGKIPLNFKYHHVRLMFLDANSWSYNYGHYLNDNVIPTFAAAKVFNVPFEGSQQMLETYCGQFSTLEAGFADKVVDYNRSMGSYRQACLAKFEGLWKFFYDHPPIYLDKMQTTEVCFEKLIGGQGAAFGLRSLDLTRAVILREFRDFVIKKLNPPPPPQENLILVALRTVGTAGGSLVSDLCNIVKNSIVDNKFLSDYTVECIVPTDLDFTREIYFVHRAKVLISVHGTISYLSMFAREGTQQIIIAHPKELKENQILLWATHFRSIYLTWDKLRLLNSIIEHAVNLSNEYSSIS
jgi:hypothetical protein